MPTVSERSYQIALEDFRRARQEAAMRQLLGRFTGKSDELLAYNEISEKLQVKKTVERGVQEIPLSAIVGSVGRAEDFTRDFLPKRDSDAERWARVKAAVMDMKGWPPIEVYQLGDVYFVKDGNHRVSVARQLGQDTITAYVTEVQTELPLDADEDPADFICRVHYNAFLEHTQLHRTRPEADLFMTFGDQYPLLEAQIAHYSRRLAVEEGEELTHEEAAARWYDEVYLPVARLIREQGILRNFEDRTETDLYVLLSERRDELEEALGWHVDPKTAAVQLVPTLETRNNVLQRLGGRLLNAVAPELADGPPPGQWRRVRQASQREKALFADILVSLQGTEADWRLLDQALQVAQREEGRILALHAVAKKAELLGTETRAIETIFYERIAKAGIEGEFAAEVGVEGSLMIKRAAWVDLVATNLTFATEPSQRRLSSGVTTLIQRCPRPILVLPGPAFVPLDHALLGYDGSAKANEALYVAAYLGARWGVTLDVVTVKTNYTSAEALEQARVYLNGRGLDNVNYILRDRPIAPAVLETAREREANLLIMGGFGFRPVRHLMVGSTVDVALQEFEHPILICR